MNKFINILQDLILDKDLNLRSLGREIGMSYQMLYAYKSEGFYPNLVSAVKIADYFGCSLDYLFGIDDYWDDQKYNDMNIKLFYPRYKELLHKHNVSHYYLYKTIGLNNSSFIKWKNGSVPKIESLIKISEYFNVSLDYLVGRSDEI